MTELFVVVREVGQKDAFLLPQSVAAGARLSEVGLRNLAAKRGARVCVLSVSAAGKITMEKN